MINEKVKEGEVFAIRELIPYRKESIVNIDVFSNSKTKAVVMAFDEGTALGEHAAPGDAIVFALEGKATIGYEGKDYTIKEGENFHFAKGGKHSVRADGRFKMALLLSLEYYTGEQHCGPLLMSKSSSVLVRFVHNPRVQRIP